MQIGQEITYTLKVTNLLDIGITDVVLLDELDLNLDYVSSPDSATFDTITNTVTIDAGDFNRENPKNILLWQEIKGTTQAGAVIKNYFTVVGDWDDNEDSDGDGDDGDGNDGDGDGDSDDIDEDSNSMFLISFQLILGAEAQLQLLRLECVWWLVKKEEVFSRL